MGITTNSYDAIMVGINTVIIDDPKLTVKAQYLKDETLSHPQRIIIDSKAKLPETAQCLNYLPEVKTFMVTTELAPPEKLDLLKKKGAIIVLTKADNNKVNLREGLKRLKKHFKIKSILVEGGGTLLWSLFKENLVDEFRFYIAPKLAGGYEAINILQGKGFLTLDDSPKVVFTHVGRCGEGIEIEGRIIKALDQ